MAEDREAELREAVGREVVQAQPTLDAVLEHRLDAVSRLPGRGRKQREALDEVAVHLDYLHRVA